MDSEIFEKLPPSKLILRCAVPAIISNIFGALYQMADGFFVGRFIGEDALAAINLIMPVIMIVFSVADMIAAGASVRVSLYLGEKKREEASKVFSSTVKIIFIISCIVGAFGFAFAEPFLRLLAPGASEKAIEYGITYIRIYSAFAPFMPVGFATDNFLRTCGKEKLSMWLGIGSQSLNIILDVIFIAFLGQGVWAAALTSCVAMALCSVISLLLFRKKRLDLYYTKENISLKTLFRILINGFSEFFSGISMSIMSIVYNFFLLRFGGTTAVAAFSVIMYVDSIAGMFLFGLCGSVQPAISYLYGAGLIDRVKSLFRKLVLSNVIFSAFSMFFMFFLGKYAAPIFVKPEDTHLLEASITGMKLFSLSYLTGWVDMCFSSYFTSLERAIRSLATSFFGTLVFPVLFLFILTPKYGLDGVWLNAFVSCTASAILTLILAFTLKIDKTNMQ